MEIITSNKAVAHKNSEDCLAYEYEFRGEKDINGAVIKLAGRYPESGKALNDICKELSYIVEGSGTLTQGGKIYTLSEGDMILIQPGEAYFFEGTLTMLISSSPAWYPGQHHNIQ
jgi:mannose-6-phosphate isomerase-like protein (cupin superfamily)